MNTRRLLSGGMLLALLLTSATALFAGESPVELRTERLVSTPLRAEFNYFQVLRCNLVNSGNEEAFGSLTIANRSGSANGSGLTSTPFTILKMAVVAPIPSASAAMARTVTVGVYRSDRMA